MASNEAANDRIPRITRIGMVGVAVSDQDRALDFYVGALGFEKRVDVANGDGGRWVGVAPPGATTTLALVQRRETARVGADTGIRLFVDTHHDEAIADVDALHADLRARGVDIDAAVAHVPGVPPMFALRDPDGNVLRIVARHTPA